ncbi:hypothetical protein [Deinococcus ruber]|nr:hypothetical protein [Deinococcus ruber]
MIAAALTLGLSVLGISQLASAQRVTTTSTLTTQVKPAQVADVPEANDTRTRPVPLIRQRRATPPTLSILQRQATWPTLPIPIRLRRGPPERPRCTGRTWKCRQGIQKRQTSPEGKQAAC